MRKRAAPCKGVGLSMRSPIIRELLEFLNVPEEDYFGCQLDDESLDLILKLEPEEWFEFCQYWTEYSQRTKMYISMFIQCFSDKMRIVLLQSVLNQQPINTVLSLEILALTAPESVEPDFLGRLKKLVLQWKVEQPKNYFIDNIIKLYSF